MKKIYIYRYMFAALSICVLITLLFQYLNMLNIIDPFTTGTKIISKDHTSFIIINNPRAVSIVPLFIFAIVGSVWLIALTLLIKRWNETVVVRYTLPVILLVISLLLYMVTASSIRLFYAKNLFLLGAAYCAIFVLCAIFYTNVRNVNASDS